MSTSGQSFDFDAFKRAFTSQDMGKRALRIVAIRPRR